MVTTLSRFVGKWSQRALSRLRENGHSAVTLGEGGEWSQRCHVFVGGNGHSDVSFCLFFCVFFFGGGVTAMSRFGGKWSQRCQVGGGGGGGHSAVTFWGEMVTALSRLGGGNGHSAVTFGGGGGMVTALSRFETHASVVAYTWSRCCFGRRGHSGITFVDTWSINCHRTHGQ